MRAPPALTIINDVDGEISVTVTKAGWAGVTTVTTGATTGGYNPTYDQYCCDY